MFKKPKIEKGKEEIPVLMNSEKVGQILKAEGKEVAGQYVMNIWVQFEMGGGALDKIRGALKRGITIGQ